MEKPDILIFMSDQHSGSYAGFAGDKIVETPNLDSIASKGTTFDNAYTSCPLCVPARTSMLTGQLPIRTGVYTNSGGIPEDQATFFHSIAAEGYETVLIGRMHFLGDDQRHGFTKRLVGDFSPMYWGRDAMNREDFGDFNGTHYVGQCLNIIGGGTSPVIEYDKAVVEAAIEYLNQDHEKPQCILVGTYQPHFPYVAPKKYYEYYRKRVQLPESIKNKPNHRHPAMIHKEQHVSEETILNARAAYYGMIENMDQKIGEVRKSWDDYLNRTSRKGVFVYLSDHGDQVGEKDLFGKQSFFELSSKIPMIFEGDGIKVNKRINEATSIMDLGPTLCDIVGATPPPAQDGKSLINAITQGEEDLNRYVLSEFMETDPTGKAIPCRMIKQGKWKLISYAFYEKDDLLFDLENDPHEITNLAEKYPEKAKELKELLNEGWDIDKTIAEHKWKLANYAILEKWGQVVDVEEPERWKVPKKATIHPDRQ